MTTSRPYRPALECPLCRRQLKKEHAMRRHLQRDHPVDDLVDYIVTNGVDAAELAG